jgi:structural maintenance of chromosome 1
VRGLLGDTLLAESLEAAREAAFGRSWGFKKVVTTEGTKVSRWGVVDVQEKSTIGNLGSGGDWRAKLDTIEKEIASLAEMIDIDKQDIADYQDQLRQIEPDILTARANSHVADQDLQRRLLALNNIRTEIESAKRKSGVAMGLASKGELQSKLGKIDEERKLRVQRLCEEFLGLFGLSGEFDWKAVAQRREHGEFERKMSRISDQISTLQGEQKKLQELRDNLAEALHKLDEELAVTAGNLPALTETEEADTERLKTEMATKEAALASAVAERETMERKFRETSEAVVQRRRAEEERATRAGALQAEMVTVTFRARDLINKAALEGVSVRQDGGSQMEDGGEGLNWLEDVEYGEVRRQTVERLERELGEAEEELEKHTEAVAGGTGGGPPATEAAEEQEKRILGEWEEAKKEYTTLSKKVEELREERKKKFDDCVAFLSTRLADYYDVLCGERRDFADERNSDLLVPVGGDAGRVPAGLRRAFLDVEVPEEPWRGGLIFRAMPPGKRLTEIAALSGGERTMASAALLFALATWSGTRFVVVDELDAALDKHNVTRLVNFVKVALPSMQIIAISLKEDVYARADGLVGVWKTPDQQTSKVACLDLSVYAEEEDTSVERSYIRA